MLTNKLFSDVHNKFKTIITNGNKDPKLVIYMDYTFYHNCIHEIQTLRFKSKINIHADYSELYTCGKILGYPIYIVSPHQKNEHSNYQIVEVE